MLTYIVLCAITILMELYIFDTYKLKEVEDEFELLELNTTKKGNLLKLKFSPSESITLGSRLSRLKIVLSKPDNLTGIHYLMDSEEYEEKIKRKGNNYYLKGFVTYNRLRNWKFRVFKIYIVKIIGGSKLWVRK